MGEPVVRELVLYKDGRTSHTSHPNDQWKKGVVHNRSSGKDKDEWRENRWIGSSGHLIFNPLRRYATSPIAGRPQQICPRPSL